jgi:GT2 family glycosyltransferase
VSEEPTVSVIVPTRNRPASLERTVRALMRQETSRPWELIVVDDASDLEIHDTILDGVPRGLLLRSRGAGPAHARNFGVAAATGQIVLFTDDDTEPDPRWLEAAAAHLDSHPDELGVEGVVRSPPFDPLYAHSLEQVTGGGYMTCNIGFRRNVLSAVGGFSEDYPFPHCEDLDLAYRVLARGPIGFAPDMAIVHHPRPLTVGQWIGRGRMAESEIVLFRRFRERFGNAAGLPARLFPLASAAGVWRTMLREARRGPLKRAARAGVIAAGYTVVVSWVSLRSRIAADP